MEATLPELDGTAKKSGAVQISVRRLPEDDFARIVELGLPGNLEADEARRYGGPVPESSEMPGKVERLIVERLMRRRYRDVAFRRRVREAYGYRCAMSGLRLRNGGGRPEVQAAHIRPEERQGSDSVRNGSPLSGTLHWMFDRGLVTGADDHQTILVSRNKVRLDIVDRLLPPGGKLYLPDDPRGAPHPANLAWHRKHV